MQEKTVFRVGDTVRAKFRISEEFMGREVVHADPGDLGTVVAVEPGHLPTVTFQSGTTYDCAPYEIEFVAPLACSNTQSRAGVSA